MVAVSAAAAYEGPEVSVDCLDHAEGNAVLAVKEVAPCGESEKRVRRFKTLRVDLRRSGRRCNLGCVRRFRLRARLAIAVGPSPVPARSNRACGLPAPGSPVRFTPRVM